jgi:chemotaxis protein histidine kinase CheA
MVVETEQGCLVGSAMNDPTPIDPALLDLFRAEMDAHIPVLNQGLLAVEKGTTGEQEIASMMRAAHSIKGAARIVGIDAAVRLAHIMEDCFTAAKEARIALTSEAVDVLLQGVDALQRICSLQPDAELSETSIESLHQRITGVRDGRRVLPTAERPPSVPGAADARPQSVAVPLPQERRVTLPENLDDAAADVLRGQLWDALREGATEIRLDFSQVHRLSASALSVLVSFVREVARAEPVRAITAIDVAGSLAPLMRVTGLDRAWTPSG